VDPRRGTAGARPAGLALAASPDHVTVADVLDVVRDPAEIDGPAVAAAVDVGASALRRRDAAAREALQHVSLRGLTGGHACGPEITPLARQRAG
jgi:hypothetical protein